MKAGRHSFQRSRPPSLTGSRPRDETSLAWDLSEGSSLHASKRRPRPLRACPGHPRDPPGRRSPYGSFAVVGDSQREASPRKETPQQIRVTTSTNRADLGGREHPAEEPQHVERAGCLADFVGCTQPMTAFWAAGMTIETPTPAPISGATSLGKVIRVLSLRCQDSVRELSQSQTRSALLQVWVYRPSDTNYSDTSASPPPWRSEQRRQRTTLSPWCVCGTLPSGRGRCDRCQQGLTTG